MVQKPGRLFAVMRPHSRGRTASRSTPYSGALAERRLPLSFIIGGGIVAIVIIIAIVSLVWTPYDPLHAVPAERFASPEWRHLLGTDRYGRDVLSQIMAGSRVTLLVGVIAVGTGACLGVPLGISAGMSQRWWEHLIMRSSDLLQAFPALLLAIVLGAVMGASTVSAMIAIGVSSVPAFARVTRASTLQVMSMDFVDAARISQRSSAWIALRHVLPNIAGVIIVQASISFSLSILAEAALSFLGLGTPPPNPSWGRMLQAAQTSLYTQPLLAVWSGGVIALVVMGFNMLGDGLRDLLDPRLHSTKKMVVQHG